MKRPAEHPHSVTSIHRDDYYLYCVLSCGRVVTFNTENWAEHKDILAMIQAGGDFAKLDIIAAAGRDWERCRQRARELAAAGFGEMEPYTVPADSTREKLFTVANQFYAAVEEKRRAS